MKIYENAGCLCLKIFEDEYFIILPNKYMDFHNYLCSFFVKLPKEKERNLYELIFNEDIRNRIIENKNKIPVDIHENCMNCAYYQSCKYNRKILKNYKKTNKILKEYKAFIESIEKGD